MCELQQKADEIFSKIKEFSIQIFGCDFTNYLDAYKRDLWGLILDYDNHQYIRFYGSPTDAFMEIANKSIPDTDGDNPSAGGYSVDVGSKPIFDGLELNADVFILLKDVFYGNEDKLNAILLHEMCHWFINSGLINQIPFIITQDQKAEGSEMAKRTCFPALDNPDHPKEFCELLVSVCDKVAMVFGIDAAQTKNLAIEDCLLY